MGCPRIFQNDPPVDGALQLSPQATSEIGGPPFVTGSSFFVPRKTQDGGFPSEPFRTLELLTLGKGEEQLEERRGGQTL